MSWGLSSTELSRSLRPDAPVYRTGRIKCGTESNGGFKNITISNCVFEDCNGLALESEDGALCEDIAISNITMRGVTTSPIFLRLGSRLRGPKESTKVGTMQRILINNLVSYNAAFRLCSILSGIPGYAIKDIKLSNIYQQHVGGARRIRSPSDRRSSKTNTLSLACSDQCLPRVFIFVIFAILR